MLTFFLTTCHNITFELYLDDPATYGVWTRQYFVACDGLRLASKGY